MTDDGLHDWSDSQRRMLKSTGDSGESPRPKVLTLEEKLEQIGADTDVELSQPAAHGFLVLWRDGEMTRKEMKRAAHYSARTSAEKMVRELREINAINERPHPDDSRKKLYRVAGK